MKGSQWLPFLFATNGSGVKNKIIIETCISATAPRHNCIKLLLQTKHA
jgi:hypothetical protein